MDPEFYQPCEPDLPHMKRTLFHPNWRCQVSPAQSDLDDPKSDPTIVVLLFFPRASTHAVSHLVFLGVPVEELDHMLQKPELFEDFGVEGGKLRTTKALKASTEAMGNKQLSPIQ
eukprot:6184997-Amphidinium_carterae.1